MQPVVQAERLVAPELEGGGDRAVLGPLGRARGFPAKPHRHLCDPLFQRQTTFQWAAT